MGKQWKQWQTLFFWTPKSLQMVTAAVKLRHSLEEKLWPRQCIKKQKHYFVNKGPSSEGYGFSSGHVWMWELGHEESWVPNNWCFWTVVLENTLESPLDCKEIQPVHPKRNESWIFTGRTDAEAETPILWPHDVKSWLIWKDPDAGKDCKWEEKGMTENEKLGGHHWFNGYEFEQAPGVGDGVLQSMGSHDWATELNWNFLSNMCSYDWHSVRVLCVCACMRACVQTVRQHLQLCRGTWRHSFTWKSWMALPEGTWRTVSGGQLSFCVRNWRT